MVNQLATSGQVQPQPGGIREVLHALKRSSDSSDGSGSEKGVWRAPVKRSTPLSFCTSLEVLSKAVQNSVHCKVQTLIQEAFGFG